MNQDHQTYQRGLGASLLGLAVQTGMFAGLGLLAIWSKGNPALITAMWHAAGGLGLWVCLVVVFQQHKLERIEAREAEQLAARHGRDSSIFEVSSDDLAVARRRLHWLYRWIVPIISILTSIYLITMGVLLARGFSSSLAPGKQVLPAELGMTLAFTAILVFIGFLISRYLSGMAKGPAWSLLRGGAAYMMGTTLLGALIILGLILTHYEITGLLRYLAVLIPAFMIVIGIEIILNFVLNLYRPRRPGEQPRPAFDSRILSLLSTPESIAHTINEAINYQFGFEITRSWFWQLLSKAFGWLILFGASVLIALSSIVVVHPQQMALVTRFGKLSGEPLVPGIHLKLPWPVEQVRYYDVHASRQFTLGHELTAEELKQNPNVILWTNQHLAGEQNLIVPPVIGDQTRPNASLEAPSVDLVNAEVMVQYRIKPEALIDYVTANADADFVESSFRAGGLSPVDRHVGRLVSMATSQITRMLLRHTIDQWIGAARVRGGGELKRSIQSEADQMKLGVEIINVSLASIHPPQDAAEAFLGVVSAEQQSLTLIAEAQREATNALVKAAGTHDLAQRIAVLARRWNELSIQGGDKAQLAAVEREIDALLPEAGGDVAVTIAQARQYRTERESAERGKAERFQRQLAAFQAAPNVYRARRLAQMLAEGLRDARKFILVGERGNLTLRGDFKELDSGFAFPDESGSK